MLKSFPYKKRLRILMIVSIFILFLSYRFAITETIKQYQDYQNFKNDAKNVDLISKSKNDLIAEEKELNELFSKFELDTISAAKNLLNIVGSYCKENQLSLKEYKPYLLSESDSMRIMTRTITLEGSFESCLNIIYYLETAVKIGRVSSVDFKTVNDIRDKKMRLLCTLYIQNIISYAH